MIATGWSFRERRRELKILMFRSDLIQVLLDDIWMQMYAVKSVLFSIEVLCALCSLLKAVYCQRRLRLAALVAVPRKCGALSFYLRRPCWSCRTYFANAPKLSPKLPNFTSITMAAVSELEQSVVSWLITYSTSRQFLRARSSAAST